MAFRARFQVVQKHHGRDVWPLEPLAAMQNPLCALMVNLDVPINAAVFAYGLVHAIQQFPDEFKRQDGDLIG